MHIPRKVSSETRRNYSTSSVSQPVESEKEKKIVFNAKSLCNAGVFWRKIEILVKIRCECTLKVVISGLRNRCVYYWNVKSVFCKENLGFSFGFDILQLVDDCSPRWGKDYTPLFLIRFFFVVLLLLSIPFLFVYVFLFSSQEIVFQEVFNLLRVVSSTHGGE